MNADREVFTPTEKRAGGNDRPGPSRALLGGELSMGGMRRMRGGDVYDGPDVTPREPGQSDGRYGSRDESGSRPTHHEAVEWFDHLGYGVEPGPGLGEVTLIDDRRPDYMSYIVVPARKLAGMAHLSQIVTAQQLFRPRRA